MHDFLDIPAASKGSLHLPERESDACGMGAIVHLKGTRSQEILNLAIESVCNMTHRGAVDADGKTGDGSGILAQIPYPIFHKALDQMGAKIDQEGDLAVGVFFMPRNKPEVRKQAMTLAEGIARKRGMRILGWREVPIHEKELGQLATRSRPAIFHLLMARPESLPGSGNDDAYERRLYITRREIERAYRTEKIKNIYIASFSSRLISYKALAMPTALRKFYEDLRDPDFKTAIALYHQRFSTNTFPAWPLGQPFRMLCHNGEINTLRGNRNWMASREEFFESNIWGNDIDLIRELLQEGESDSASLDHALELLVLSGRSLEHAMCMLVPPAYRNQMDISDDLRAFYQYLRSFSEPWDGPAGLVYTDGFKVCASLDRNGLRPSRFKLQDDGLLYIGSEIGTIPMDEARVTSKGRLGPGQMLSANTLTGELKFDLEIKEELARQAPYAKWVKENRVELDSLVDPKKPDVPSEFDPLTLSQLQVSHGINKEELDMTFRSMVAGGQEAVFSMGDDIPLSCLSRQPRNLFTYFKQLFAQVTNPPIDPIRERAVMTIAAGLGPERNLLGETAEHARLVNLESAILTQAQLDRISKLDDVGFASRTLDATFPVAAGPAGLEESVDRLCKEAETAVDENIPILILSDRGVDQQRAAIPSLMFTGAVHHHLNRVRKRMRASLVIDTGEVRDTHQLACIFGYGGTAVCPYLGYATVVSMLSDPSRFKLKESLTTDKALANYRIALEKGLLKIMSKMGISVLNSYQGAQIFEAIGIGSKLIDKCFTGTPSQIAGLDFKDIAAESIARHEQAYGKAMPEGNSPLELGDPGYNRYQRGGEQHVITPGVVKSFHTFVKSGSPQEYEEYVQAVLESNPVSPKDLLEYVPAATGPIPLEEVEPIEDVRIRFTTAAMSMGAISPEAHETLAIAMNRIGGKSDSGEGGEDPIRFRPYDNGDWANSKIKQVASGRFGVTPEYLSNCEEIEIKIAQGAKPGEGGQLPAFKVNGLIAKLRRTQPGVQLISPPPHHDIYSIEDLAQLIHDLKEVNPRARVTVKLVAGSGCGTIAAGVAKANADIILISGHEGGTGASPLTSIKHAGLPWELGIAEAQQVLMLNKLRDRITLRTDGGLRNGHDIIKAAILGAEEYNFGTIALIAMGCVYVRRCHLNDCPVGVATTDPKFRARFKGTPEMVVNFFNGVAQEVREIMASLGVRKLNHLIGRPEFLRQREITDHPKANKIDLSRLLRDVTIEMDEDVGRYWAGHANTGIHKKSLDDTIIQQARISIVGKKPVELHYRIVNTDRNIGTKLSGEVAYLHGDLGLPEGTITLHLNGSAGQSLATFLCQGIHIVLTGEANDYVGKGMTAGKVIVKPPHKRLFDPAENSILGNTCLYGATGGHLFANGKAGERFAVRNSGATGVIEGCGDHGCEYMTNGTIAVLGLTGINFGAGMSGGKAYVLDEDGRFRQRINPEMIVVQAVERPDDIAEIKSLIQDLVKFTGSPKGRQLLDNWDTTLQQLLRVVPLTHAEAEAAEELHENAGEPVEARM